MSELTRDSLIEAATQAAKSMGGVLSRTDFQRVTGISQHQIHRAGVSRDGRGKPLPNG